MADKVYVKKGEDAEEYSPERRRHVRFPFCLAVKYGRDVPDACYDFTLNISKGGVFIKSNSPLPKGAKIIMHFYIPPENKLLGEFKGKVVRVNADNPAYPTGMHVQFTGHADKDLKRLEDYLEENRHLVDRKV